MIPSPTVIASAIAAYITILVLALVAVGLVAKGLIVSWDGFIHENADRQREAFGWLFAAGACVAAMHALLRLTDRLIRR